MKRNSSALNGNVSKVVGAARALAFAFFSALMFAGPVMAQDKPDLTHKEKKAIKSQDKADKKADIAQAEADQKKTKSQNEADEKKAAARVDSAKKQ